MGRMVDGQLLLVAVEGVFRRVMAFFLFALLMIKSICN